MKTNELIERLKDLGFTVSDEDGFIQIRKDGIAWTYSKDISSYSVWVKASLLIAEYYQTPLDERKSEKKYRVRLQGFNRGNHQYLSTDNNPYMGQIFASTWNPCYNQVFTKSELEAIQNRPQFKGVIWFRELIKDGLREFNGDDKVWH